MTADEVAARARTLFRAASFGVRCIQPLRVRICPMETLVAAVPDGTTVFDIGCGPGLLLGLLAPRITLGIGVDASAPAIAAAEAMRGALPADESQRLSVAVAADVTGWPAGTFTVVSLVDVLHHVPPGQQQTVITAAAKKVAPGGILLFKDIPPRPRWRALMNTLHDLVMARQWARYRSGDEVAAWMETAGLRIERRERHNRWWYAHELIIARRPVA